MPKISRKEISRTAFAKREFFWLLLALVISPFGIILFNLPNKLYGQLFANEFMVWVWSFVAYCLIYAGLGGETYSAARKHGFNKDAIARTSEIPSHEDLAIETLGPLMDLSFKEFIAPKVMGFVYFLCIWVYLRFALGVLWDPQGDYGINIALNLGIELNWKYLMVVGLLVLAIIRVSMEAAIALIIVAQNTSDIMDGTTIIANTLESGFSRSNITGDYQN